MKGKIHTPMQAGLRALALTVISLGFAAVNAQATAIQVTDMTVSPSNFVCELGNCSNGGLNSGSITYGQSISSTSFMFDYSPSSGDLYQISGNYAASYTADGVLFTANIAATYVGSGPSSEADSFTVDVFQNIFDDSPGNWDGTYTETAPVVISGDMGAGISTSVELLWDGQSVGVIGPYIGDGSFNGSASKDLTGLDDSTLAGDFRFAFSFGAASVSGGTVNSPTPEPAQTVPAALILVVGGMLLRRRLRKSAAPESSSAL